jgi:capsular exopolysaccharide synthesis family protein
MSGIYEALRQKREEMASSGSALARGASAEVGEATEESELGGLGEVLQAMVSVALEEGHVDQAALTREIAQARPGIDVKPVNEYRHLRLADPNDPSLLFRNDPDGLAAEQFRFLRRSLEQKFPSGAILLITSPAPKDGKSLTTLNLCTCLAETKRPTLLVEADVRQPSLSEIFGHAKDVPGIESAFAGTASPQSVIHSIEELAICVALVGEPPNDPSRVIGNGSAKRFLSWARENFTWIVIDAPPVLPAVDVSLLTGLADATLLVVRSYRTPRGLTARAIEMLGNNLSGVIMNDAAIASNSYGYVNYGRKKSSSRRRDSSNQDQRQ